MTIDWTKPVEHIDGTPLVRALKYSSPDGCGDYYLTREDGEPFAADQRTALARTALSDVVVVTPAGRYWGVDDDTVYVRNRAEKPTYGMYIDGDGRAAGGVYVDQQKWALATGGREVTMGERIRAVIDAIKSDEQLLADVRALLQPATPTSADPPLRQRMLFARPSNGCSYITAGKLYRVVAVRDDSGFVVHDDDGDSVVCSWDNDTRIEGSWQRVWMDVDGTEQC